MVLVILEEEHHILALMFDIITKKELWRKSWPNGGELCDNNVLLTSSFYAYLYVKAKENEVERRLVMLRILDAKTGREVHEGVCWQYTWPHPESIEMGDELELKSMAVAGKNKLCVATALSSSREYIVNSEFLQSIGFSDIGLPDEM